MKKLVVLLFCFILNWSHSQTIVDQFGYTSGWCSGTYYLYSDSSFVHERGCEQRSSITLGEYIIKGDTIYLYPKRFDQVNFVLDIEFLDTDTSGIIMTNYVALNDSTVMSQTKYPSIENAELWKKGVLSTSLLRDDSSMKFNFEIFGSEREMSKNYNPLGMGRTNSDTLAVCPTELESLLRERQFYKLPPNINQVNIHINLPFNILSQFIRYEMKYEELKPTIFEDEGRIVKIEYR